MNDLRTSKWLEETGIKSEDSLNEKQVVKNEKEASEDLDTVENDDNDYALHVHGNLENGKIYNRNAADMFVKGDMKDVEVYNRKKWQKRKKEKIVKS